MKQQWLAAALIAAALPLAHAADPAPAKKKLIDQIIASQQEAFTNGARGTVQQSAVQLVGAANQVIQTQVPADKREAVLQQIQNDARKYVDDASPIAIATVKKLAPVKVPPVLDAKFNEAELKTLLAWLQSPVSKKFQEIGPELQKALIEPMVAEAGPQITPKLQALEQRTRDTLRAAVPGAAASAPAAPASK
jgi:uncharacterized protein